MAQILDSLPSDDPKGILCCYVNATSQIQIARISNIPNWYFERVVFPGQRLVFEALPEALVEIHSGMMASAILSDTIPCTRLVVSENSSPPDKSAPQPSQDATNNKQTVETVNHKSQVTSEPLALASLS
ncbi:MULTISPECIES: DUF1830 domain-containing protein [unclassified Coleofasciculus]|uniref:DUF1830 domain-containing protein n=1 Tax=unclassified Coleofasciculus TaxID=2692782 RepID=UPI00187ED9E6|nr:MULTISPECIES: DUF1830 domain-containing protein [unclassified Coleofasciculus]MBE9127835.1 DUF1830 domain-containing protein [Coleofasciculus sp. LEGE 07081]MBE9148079.1 DUF1830 domain-containing protein [Coleofasciculus sp. LEGE 07092]